MALSLANYLQCVREALNSALCIENFPSQVVEKHNKPIVETQESKELLLNPIVICRNEFEKCLIESSINSVRISFAIKKTKEIEELLVHLYERFISVRADKFEIIRKKPISGYDFSFLVTNFHLEKMVKEEIINTILQFMQDMEKEINDMKLQINLQMRIAAGFFISQIATQTLDHNNLMIFVYRDLSKSRSFL
eukprot:TRINITY_DN17525_c0_g1_i1.p2 TRINITY_DN17525_c0_g1~~TRINITY_DN17525_c0_g1_i1.p2  ORF type:complete len:194 (-),score=19.36 TRINITY_DN17525_c0_g1_i1:521-1102(-)